MSFLCRSLPSGSAAQSQQIQRFKELLTTAEQLKQQHQADPAAAEYSWRKSQAKHLAEQVREFASGAGAAARPDNTRLLVPAAYLSGS